MFECVNNDMLRCDDVNQFKLGVSGYKEKGSTGYVKGTEVPTLPALR